MGKQGERQDSGLIHIDKDHSESSELAQLLVTQLPGTTLASPILNLKFLSPILRGTSTATPETKLKMNLEEKSTTWGMGTSPQPS
jgi:hypothetical protein